MSELLARFCLCFCLAEVLTLLRSTRDNGSSKEYWIELSEKVLTSEGKSCVEHTIRHLIMLISGLGRILNTVAHEMCHRESLRPKTY